jgi:hypothetical protein
VPVVIVAAQTGVTDGKAATQSFTYTPDSINRCSAGARPEATARSSISGFSASITTSTSLRLLPSMTTTLVACAEGS